MMQKGGDTYIVAEPQPAPSEDVAVTELIVHGVGGAPPGDLLNDYHPLQVSGDHHAGFYRPQEPPRRGDLEPEAFPREAFAWGGLTSGDKFRALWFFLLPFALMNASGWMHPPGARRPGHAPKAKAALRLLSALGTVMAVMMFTHLTLDLVAYQCGWRNATCRDGHWWLSWLSGSWFAGRPGRIIAFAALVPLAGLTAIWFAGLLSFRRFDAYLGVGAPTEPTDQDTALGLGDASFWQGGKPVRRLRRLHFQIGVTTLAVTLGVTAAELGPSSWPAGSYVVVWGGCAVLALLLALVAHPRAAVSGPSPIHDGLAATAGGWTLAWVALIGAAVTAAWVIDPLDRTAAPARLDGLIPVETILTSSQAAVGLVLAVVLALAARRRRRRGSFLGMGPVIAQLLGWFMIISVWAGTGIRLADWFGEGRADATRFWHSVAGTCDDGAFCYPIWFEDAAVAFAGILVVGVLIGAITVAWRAGAGDVALVAPDYQIPTAEPGSQLAAAIAKRQRSIARRFRQSRLVAAADEILTALMLVGVAAFVVISALQGGGWRFWSPLVTASGWLVAGVPIALVFAVRLGLNSPTARRGIGGVFDVLTFFPRRVHPFAPPCYGERAVPQLAWRLGWLTERGGAVVVRAHSQGTAVSAAALLHGVPRPERVSLMTYGSPLAVLYERHFPAYFGGVVPAVGAALGAERSRWVHLYARTDVLGCRLACGSSSHLVQSRVKDPERWRSVMEGDPPPEPLGHSTYHRHHVADAWAVHLMKVAAGRASTAPEVDAASDCCRPPCGAPGPERVIATEAHTPSERPPLVVRVGEEVTAGERDDRWPAFALVTTAARGEGWVPSRYLSADQGRARVVRAYATRELATAAGETLEVLERDDESGWLWCVNATGGEGWVPVGTVQPA